MDVFGWLLLLLIPFILIFFIRKGTPRIHAIRQVAGMFLKSGAMSPDTALTRQELGIKAAKQQGNPFINLLFGSWGLAEEEIQQDALHYLINNGIVFATPDKRLYLSETKLKASGLNRGLNRR